MVCECPWYIHRKTYKYAIKVEWLYFLSEGSEPLLDQNANLNIFDDATPDVFNDPPK